MFKKEKLELKLQKYYSGEGEIHVEENNGVFHVCKCLTGDGGKIILMTINPKQFIFNNNYDGFYCLSLEERKLFNGIVLDFLNWKQKMWIDEEKVTLKMIREQYHLTQAELGKLLDVSKTGIMYWETGRRKMSDKYKEKLADALDVPCSKICEK